MNEISDAMLETLTIAPLWPRATQSRAISCETIIGALQFTVIR